MSLQRGIIKYVLSGDSIMVITGRPTNGPPPEKVISLAWTQSPRLGSSRANNEEEPFAYEAREALRKWVIGKEVFFRVEYTVPSGREYVNAWVGDTNLAQYLLSHGLIKLRPGSGKDQSPDFMTLLETEQQAQRENVGLWNNDNPNDVSPPFSLSASS